jgi:hypothetical protein
MVTPRRRSSGWPSSGSSGSTIARARHAIEQASRWFEHPTALAVLTDLASPDDDPRCCRRQLREASAAPTRTSGSPP